MGRLKGCQPQKGRFNRIHQFADLPGFGYGGDGEAGQDVGGCFVKSGSCDCDDRSIGNGMRTFQRQNNGRTMYVLHDEVDQDQIGVMCFSHEDGFLSAFGGNSAISLIRKMLPEKCLYGMIVIRYQDGRGVGEREADGYRGAFGLAWGWTFDGKLSSMKHDYILREGKPQSGSGCLIVGFEVASCYVGHGFRGNTDAVIRYGDPSKTFKFRICGDIQFDGATPGGEFYRITNYVLQNSLYHTRVTTHKTAGWIKDRRHGKLRRFNLWAEGVDAP